MTEQNGARLLAAFALAIFTSAFLLFSIQPMFTKMVLPQLGGSPAVWSIAMVFFQALLLAGYLYAHLLTRFCAPRSAAFIHLGVMVLAFIALPIGVSAHAGEPPASGQELWLIGVFLASVGLPFFAVSGNGPLLQAWFARSRHPQADDPYFLYGASNLGSFAALLLYPVAIEPLFRLKTQSWAWSIGFAVLIGLIGLAAFMLRVGARDVSLRVVTPPPRLRQILIWIALSFIPSGLLVAVTAHISTDVAAAPFLWVAPLALYLLTFVLLFRDKPLVPMRIIYLVMPLAACGLLIAELLGNTYFLLTLGLHIGFFMLATLVCHAQLYATRPAAEHLTSFYLWMSFGGVLGGIFCGLIAPNIFNRILEYPILVVCAVFVAPGALPKTWERFFKQAQPILLIGTTLFLALLWISDGASKDPGGEVKVFYMLTVLMVAACFIRPLVLAMMLPFLFMAQDALQHMKGRSFERSFFGVHKIETAENGQFRLLAHGTTIHGAIRVVNADGSKVSGRPKPLTYYHPDGPMAEVLATLPTRAEGRRIGIIGLGAGAFTCNGAAADQWTLFEIDSKVVEIATDATKFRFLSECAPRARHILGDARLTLAKEQAAAFDLLMIDAFSSDSIPVHLLTREAISLYLEKLASDGVLLIHISNRHMALKSVVGAIASSLNVQALHRNDQRDASSLEAASASEVSIITRDQIRLKAIADKAGWMPLDGKDGVLWTDDFSNILSVMWRRYAK